MDPFTYFLPAALNRKKLSKKFPNEPQYKLSLEKTGEWQGKLLDSFDEKMLSNGKMLFQVEEMLICFDLQSGHLIEQVSSEPWSFPSDLPDGPVALILKEASGLRAFLPVAEVELNLQHGTILDDERKTRARLHNLTLSRGGKTVSVGSTQHLRGYDQAHADLRHSLEKIGAVFCRDVDQVYGSLKIKREKYTSKPVIHLDPDAPVKKSAQTIINAFLRVSRQNEKGIIADYDTEFLHDYRVSLRKVRSVLSLFKGVYSPEDTDRLKQDFASLMQKTNSLRDLDVYLLNKKHYFSLVPDDTHEGLEILFDYFAGERGREQKRVSQIIKSKTYLKEIVRLQKLFGDGASLVAGPKGDDKSLAFACMSILKRYNKVCKVARSIDENTEDETVHQLRINCKKLRYLIEFFAPIFPEDEIKSLIKSLKVLQDNLGNFNDYSVQQAYLRQVLSEKMGDFGGAELKVAESIGALTAMLNRLQQKERRQVMKNFELFDSSETRAILANLFNTEEIVHENNSLLQ